MYQQLQQNWTTREEMGNCANNNDVMLNSNEKDLEFHPSVVSKAQDKNQQKITIHKMIKFDNKSLKLPPVYRECYSTIETLLNCNDKDSFLKLGKAYQTLMLYNHAIAAYQKCLQTDSDGPVEKKAKVQLVECFLSVGKYQQALEKCREIENHIKQNYGEASREYIKFLTKKGQCQSSLCKISEAKEIYTQATAIIDKQRVPSMPEHCSLYCKLAQLYINEGYIEIAVQMATKSHFYASQLQQSLEAAQATLELSNIYQTLGCKSVAAELLDACEKFTKQGVGVESPEYVNVLLFQIAFAKNCQEFEQCQALIKRCEQIILKIFGEDSIQYAELKSEEGLCHLGKANNVAAIKCFNQSFKIFEGLEQEVNQACPLILIQKIVAYLKIGSQQKTLQICDQAYKLVNQIYGENSIQAAEIGAIFVQIMFQNEYLQVAQQSCQEILQIYEGFKLQQCANYIKAVTNLGHILQAKGELQNALKYFNIALKLFQNQQKTNWIYAQICQSLGEVLNEQGQGQVGREYREQSALIYQKLKKAREGLNRQQMEQNDEV